MDKPTLVVLAAGMGSRYGGLKQVDPVGPSGEAILDYSVFDAIRAGFGHIVFVIRKDIEEVFKAQIGSKYDKLIRVSYAFQELDDLPWEFKVPEGRTKPWGTGHAIRAARDLVDGMFAVINADDFYGRDAFQKMCEFLEHPIGENEGLISALYGWEHYPLAMVGYKLRNTLSENGSVARGICSVDKFGRLEKVVEHTKLVKSATGAHDEDPAATEKDFPGDALVSMNLWGFSPDIFYYMDDMFRIWLQENINREKSEWYIPLVVSKLIDRRDKTVNVLPTDSTWFGVTYQEDKPIVKEEIRKLVAAGEYPECLFPKQEA